METINKNGYEVIWEQSSGKNKQIICFNEESNSFQAFDRYAWSDENNALKREGTGNELPLNGFDFDVNWETKAVDLWTPIKMIFTKEWLTDVLHL